MFAACIRTPHGRQLREFANAPHTRPLKSSIKQIIEYNHIEKRTGVHYFQNRTLMQKRPGWRHGFGFMLTVFLFTVLLLYGKCTTVRKCSFLSAFSLLGRRPITTL